MKKALVLGVLAFFAIATVQNVNAQDKKKVTTKETVEIKNDQNAGVSTEKKVNLNKSAAASIQQRKIEKRDVKSEKKEVKNEKQDVKTLKKDPTVESSVEKDPTQKNTTRTLNRSVPPKPNSNASSSVGTGTNSQSDR